MDEFNIYDTFVLNLLFNLFVPFVLSFFSFLFADISIFQFFQLCFNSFANLVFVLLLASNC